MQLRLEERVNTYGSFLKHRYGERVFKVGIKLAPLCSHKHNRNGCIFCLTDSFQDREVSAEQSVREQLSVLIPKIKHKCGVTKFLVYFQDGTVTVRSAQDLKQLLNQALEQDEVGGVVIATRPDCLTEEKMQVLAATAQDVYLEIGVQTIHRRSLDFLNRGHTFEDIEQAVLLADQFGIEVTAQLIIGIPGEGLSEMIETIEFINKHKIISQVKLHNLVVYEDTELSRMEEMTLKQIPSYDEYIVILGELLPYLRGEKVIGRFFTSNLNQSNASLNPFPGVKRIWLNRLNEYLNDREIIQGQKTESEFRKDFYHRAETRAAV